MYYLRGKTTGELLLARVRAGAPGSRLRPLTMMLDTGATVSLVDEGVLEQLGSTSHQVSWVTGLGGRKKYSSYLLVVEADLDSAKGTESARLELEVIGQSLPETAGYAGILGMDVLRHFKLVYDGPRRTFELSSARPPHVTL